MLQHFSALGTCLAAFLFSTETSGVLIVSIMYHRKTYSIFFADVLLHFELELSNRSEPLFPKTCRLKFLAHFQKELLHRVRGGSESGWGLILGKQLWIHYKPMKLSFYNPNQKMFWVAIMYCIKMKKWGLKPVKHWSLSHRKQPLVLLWNEQYLVLIPVVAEKDEWAPQGGPCCSYSNNVNAYAKVPE